MKLDEEKWYVHHFKDKDQKRKLKIYLPKEPVEQNQSFAEKHPIIANILQAELVVAGLIVTWFLVTFFYQVGYFKEWGIPKEFMEIDLIAGTKFQVVMTYITILGFIILLFMIHPSGDSKIVKLIINVMQIMFIIFILYLVYMEWEYGDEVTQRVTQRVLLQHAPFMIWLYIALFSFILYGIISITIRKRKLRFSSMIMLVIMVSTGIPNAVGQLTNSDFPIIYKNGKMTNQVIVSTYRDYFLVGYYKGNIIYPCYRLVKMVDDDKLNETEVAPKSQKKVFKYSNDQYQISTSNIQFKPPDHFNKKSCPNF